MKKLLFAALLMIATMATAQDLNEDLKNALATDNASDLKKHITSKNINRCYTVEKVHYTVLALAIKENATNCLTSLLAEKANTEKACSDRTPLMYAAEYGRLDMAKALVKAGAKLKVRNSKGKSAYDYAKRHNQQEIIQYFNSFDR